MRKTELARVFAMARKGAMKWNSFARTTSRKRVQGEALFIVVSLAATLGQHGPRRGDVPAKLFHYMALFLAMA